MSEFPALPEHYVKRTIGDMLPDDIYYLRSETLGVDRESLRPYFNRYTPLTPYDQSPQRLIGRYGIMRVLGEDIDGYVIDIRLIDSYELEQDDVAIGETEGHDTLDDIDNDCHDLISPLGILAQDENMKEELLLGDPSIHPYLLHLCNHTDELHEQISRRTSKKKQPSVAKNTQKPTVPTNIDYKQK